MLETANPNQDPINYIELCLLLHDAQCVLNRNDEALWSAKRARRVAENLEPRDYPGLRERIDFFRVNTIRAEVIALHNLKLNQAAFDLCQEAEAPPRDRKFWTPHVNRDKINALAELSRFSITLAEELAQQVRAICDARADDYDPLLSLLIAQSLARAFIKHQNFKDAYRVLSAEYDRLPQIPHVGPLHQVIFLRTFARLYWRQGARGAEWKYFVSEALRVAQHAGLEHQVNELRAEYGSHLEEAGLEERNEVRQSNS